MQPAAATAGRCRPLPHGYFLIKKSTLVFEQLSPSSFNSKQHVQYSVVGVAAVALRVELPERGTEQVVVLHGRGLGLLAQEGHQGVPKLLGGLVPPPVVGESDLYPQEEVRRGCRGAAVGCPGEEKEEAGPAMVFLGKKAESAAMENSLFRSSPEVQHGERQQQRQQLSTEDVACC